jgi:plastocyanin
MTPKRLVTTGVLAVSVAIAAVPLATAAAPKLNGTVGPGFTIALTQGGKAVKSIKAGSYTFVVSDKATIHNFALERTSGKKNEKVITTVPGTGTKSVVIKLEKGTYKFYCQPHESSMVGTFTVS